MNYYAENPKITLRVSIGEARDMQSAFYVRRRAGYLLPRRLGIFTKSKPSAAGSILKGGATE